MDLFRTKSVEHIADDASGEVGFGVGVDGYRHSCLRVPTAADAPRR